MTNKIFRSTIFVAAVVLLCSLGIVMGVLYGYFNNVQIGQLKDELSLAASLPLHPPLFQEAEYCQSCGSKIEQSKDRILL